MATLSRVFAKLFGSNADPNINGQIGQFGSAKAGTKLNTADIATIQALPAYLTGWAAAVMAGRNFPPIEEVTGVLKTFSYQICYMLQEGIPEWDATTVYSATSITKVINGNQLDFYISKREQSGNQPETDGGTNWVKAIIVGDREIGVPQITLNFGSGGIPANCIELQGQTVSRTTYNNLFAIYGTTYGVGDGSTTFRLPNFVNKAIYGGTSVGYISAALPDLKLENASSTHNHGTITTSPSGGHTPTMKSAGAHTHSSRKTSEADDGGDYFTAGKSADNPAIQTASDGSHTHTMNAVPAHTHTVTIGNGGSHTHTITSTNTIIGQAALDKVWTDGIRVRVFTRYK